MLTLCTISICERRIKTKSLNFYHLFDNQRVNPIFVKKNTSILIFIISKKNRDMEAVLNKPFNKAQIELIQLLAQDLETEELAELRKLLVAFRFNLVEQRAERIAQAKGWTEAQINQMSQEHHRIPYKTK